MTLTEIAGDAPFESFYLNQSSTLRGLRGLHNAMQVPQAGFTTLRDIGNSAEWAMSDVRRAIDSGWFVGPTIIDSDGPAEIRKAVRRSCYGSTRRGSVAQQGLSADLVAMPANPLEDIENLRKINFVMKDGKIVRR
ncbi:MAG: hypothetical protein QOK23_2090, partial [Gammaproteobacteria bacterium]|nr:hypothetical protein [Gammaproteobacteria bacterium]